MDNKRLSSVVKSVVLVAFLGIQGVVMAGRVDSSMEASNAPSEPAKCVTSDKVAEHSHTGIVHDNMASDSAADNAKDSQLADYLELHGRVVDGSIRSTMMPWSALQHVAN